MKIAHIAPYGPNTAGIYEAARDMCRADIMQGHTVFFVDAGAQHVGEPNRQPCQVGVVDDRAGFKLVTASSDVCNQADVIMLHTGCDNQWLVWNQAPIIMVVHGTPIAAFRVEQRGPLTSYSVYTEGSQWPRVKAMLYFWPEFQPYWNVVFPPEKSLIFDYPPIDRARFVDGDDKWKIPRFQQGRYNGLICDSWREDSDILEILHGAMEASRCVQGLTWHIYAANQPLGPYEHLVQAMRKHGWLGMIGGRLPDMERVYRAFDFVLSGRRSISRIIAEALCCGTPVIADRGCRAANYTADKEDPYAVAMVVEQLVRRLENDHDGLKAETATLADHFDLGRYGKAISAIYDQIV